MRKHRHITATAQLRTLTTDWMDLKGLTRTEIYTKAGMNHKTLRRWERGEGELRVNHLLALLDLLGLALYIGEAPKDHKPHIPGGGQ